MKELYLGEVESHFADLVWKHEPIPSGDLAKVCERELCWKRPTTYTVLRKLCEKGLFRNEHGVVTAVMTRDEFYAKKSEQFISETYGGSLPAFLAAFTSQHPLTQKEIEEIQCVIDLSRKKG